MSVEEERLAKAGEEWKEWGPYLSERQWGTVREDYSAGGDAWDYLSYEDALYKAYRWGEDGIAGISDQEEQLCLAFSFWNGEDKWLKERLFGLTNSQGNHGEDVKEYYYYLDNTPTHSYMKYLYKYPQGEFPYQDLIETNQGRGREELEYELLDTGAFAEDRYYDIYLEYAKESPKDIIAKATVHNRGPEMEDLYLLPTLWFRNNWLEDSAAKPQLSLVRETKDCYVIGVEHDQLAEKYLYLSKEAELLFTENETNKSYLYDAAPKNMFSKDGIHDYLVNGNQGAVKDELQGTKMSAAYRLEVGPEKPQEVYLRLTNKANLTDPFAEVEATVQQRSREADEFYEDLAPQKVSDDEAKIQRQSLAGLLWTKQFYYYHVDTWLAGDEGRISPPEKRKEGRNKDWKHVQAKDIISMPDKWEYPWFAAWDLAFHLIPLALVDPTFAKEQLLLLTKEWYMHSNGQIPAYEWDFGDVNPPVQAWAALRIYRIEQERFGRADDEFLKKIFHKLLLNFTWWVNRKDSDDKNIFEGGFLGLDNIGVFDRSEGLPIEGELEQSDATSWMAMYCLNMLGIALELAPKDKSYEDLATKFFEHFLYIATAINNLGAEDHCLWNQEDGFYYDVLHKEEGGHIPLKIRSLVGLIPLLAVETIEAETLEKLPDFKERMESFFANNPEMSQNIACIRTKGQQERRLLSIVNEERLTAILNKMLDEAEFLSPHGIRSLSKYHEENPYRFELDGLKYSIQYEPAESRSHLFGGNSNWRGPVWFPINYLLVESLQKFDHYYGDKMQIECPAGSGDYKNLWEVSAELSERLISIFRLDEEGRRPTWGGTEKYSDPHWRNNLLFHEYFHGDNGAGIGANHQTGWTGLVAKLIQQRGEYR